MSQDYDDEDYARDNTAVPSDETTAPETEAGASRVIPPAILMLITGVVNMGVGVLFCFFGFSLGNAPDKVLEDALARQGAQQQEALKQEGIGLNELRKIYLYGCGGGGVIGIACSLLTLVGGICMLARKARGLAYFSALVTLLPCVNSPCLILGIPAGIWSLVVLGQPDVKAAFR